MSYSLSKIQEEVKAACNKAGVELTVPVTLNGRLTKTLGRVKYVKNNITGYTKATAIEFSKQLVESAADGSIKDVILHECAHYVVTTRTHEAHGHDNIFKSVCAELGTTNDGISTDVKWAVPDSHLYKYQIYCPTCDSIVANYNRKGKIINNIDSCKCGRCKQGGLKVIQHW